MKKLLMIMGAVLSSVVITGCAQVDSGEAALESHWGRIEGEVLRPGLHFYNPISTEIIKYDCRFRLATYNMESYTKDMQQAVLQIAFNYAIDPIRLKELHIKYGTHYGQKILDPIVHGAVKDVIGNWEAAELIHSREKATNQIVCRIEESIKTMPVMVRDINLTNVEFTPVFEKAIEEKQVAQQAAITAKNRTAQIEEEARQRIISAEAEAKSLQIKGEAMRANKDLIMLEAIQKWDGKAPHTLVIGDGANTFLPLTNPAQ